MDYMGDVDEKRRRTSERVRQCVQRTREVREALLANDWPVIRTVQQGPGHRVCQVLVPRGEQETEMGRSTIVRLHKETQRAADEFGGEWKFNPEVPSFYTVVPMTLDERPFHGVVSYNHNRNEWVAMVIHENRRGSRSGVDEDALEAIREAVSFTRHDMEQGYA